MKQHLTRIAVTTALLILTASCSLSANQSKWAGYSFNGLNFLVGDLENRPSIWLRDGYFPRVEKPRDMAIDYDKLPPNTGVIAGICFVQTTGGKLADQSGVRPLPDEQITIRSRKYGESVTKSDAVGFFMKKLVPGEYQLFCRGKGVEVRVKEGQTVLVPIRGVKRMAD